MPNYNCIITKLQNPGGGGRQGRKAHKTEEGGGQRSHILQPLPLSYFFLFLGLPTWKSLEITMDLSSTEICSPLGCKQQVEKFLKIWGWIIGRARFGEGSDLSRSKNVKESTLGSRHFLHGTVLIWRTFVIFLWSSALT